MEKLSVAYAFCLAGAVLAAGSVLSLQLPASPGLPDFEIWDIMLTPGEPDPNLMLRVRNNGDDYTGDIAFSLAQSGSPAVVRNLTIRRGETAHVMMGTVDRARLYASRCGLHYGARVDPANLIREENEGNNTLSKTLLKYGTADGCIVLPVQVGREGFKVKVLQTEGSVVSYFVEDKHIFFDKLTGKHRFTIQVSVRIKNCGLTPITAGRVLMNVCQGCGENPSVSGLSLIPGETKEVALTLTFRLKALKSLANRPRLMVDVTDVPDERAEVLFANSFCDFYVQFNFTPDTLAFQERL